MTGPYPLDAIGTKRHSLALSYRWATLKGRCWRLRQDGVPVAQIARMVGCDASWVYRVLTRLEARG